MISNLLGVSLAAYFIASVLYLANLHIKHRRLDAYGTAVAVVGFVLQTIRLISQILAHMTPFVGAQEAMFFLSWAVAGLYLVTLLWFKLQAIGALAMPLAAIALVLVYRFTPSSGPPLANDAWLNIHIFAIITSFSLFILAFCCAVLYLVQNKLLKSKKLRGMFRRLPPLQTVDTLAHTLAAVGFPLLTLGIITGIVGVELAELKAANAEIRLITAGITWLVYGAYLLAYSRPGWRGKKANEVLIIGALLIILTTSLHSFV